MANSSRLNLILSHLPCSTFSVFLQDLKERTISYAIPKTGKLIRWSRYFTLLELNSTRLNIAEYTVYQADLSQVYFSICRQDNCHDPRPIVDVV